MIWADDSPQNGKATIRGFRMLREEEFFKKIAKDKNKFIIWADAGKHFKCNEVVSYFLEELAEEKIHGYYILFLYINFNVIIVLISNILILVNLNFFCEKHGKNLRDTHFSSVSKFVKEESLVKKLECSQDIVDAIEKRQKIANDNKNGLII